MARNLLTMRIDYLNRFIGKRIKSHCYDLKGIIVGYDDDRLIVKWTLNKDAKSWDHQQYELISSDSGNYDLI